MNKIKLEDVGAFKNAYLHIAPFTVIVSSGEDYQRTGEQALQDVHHLLKSDVSSVYLNSLLQHPYAVNYLAAFYTSANEDDDLAPDFVQIKAKLSAIAKQMPMPNIGLIMPPLINKGTRLFFHFPETGLHPTVQHKLMDVLIDLAFAGVNVAVHTLSVDMLKCLEVRANAMLPDEAEQFFAVNLMQNGKNLTEQVESFYEQLATAKKDLGAAFVAAILTDLP